MDPIDPFATQRGQTATIAAELEAAGFSSAAEIGRGGFGVVYRCMQEQLDRLVAIKVLTSDLSQETLDRFLREQRAMGRLSGHPNIVTILQVGVTGSGQPFLVMPYFSQGSLDTSIRRSGQLAYPEVLRNGVKIASALEAAHRLDILHRDVKPANILLSEYGDAQLTDFGIARIPGGFRTSTGTIAGSPAFTAPEVLKGEEPSVLSDVYGLGATLFCALTGHAAFARRGGEQLVAQFLRITSEAAPPLRGKDIPPSVSEAIEHAMASDPAHRPRSAAAFGDELRQAQRLSGLGIDASVVPSSSLDDPSNEPEPSDGYVGAPRMQTRMRPPAALTPPTPATRFRPPIPTKTPVLRKRLITSGGDQPRRLTVIHAPAGYGKSTLAAQLRQALADDGVAAAWLTVDQDDNNVVWFLAHLIEAIRQVKPTLSSDLTQVLEEHGDQAERYVLTSLINSIHEAGERVVLILDDWHRVTDALTIAALAFMLDNGCHHLQFIVTSRTRHGLPLSRMQVRDELVEIDAAALRFDRDESKRFLVDLNGLVLDDSEVARLTASTDGWVAALQLASLSLRDAPDPGTLIDHLSGRHRAIGEYLVENVLDTVESDILDFLLTTCITERICGDLAQELADATNAQTMLEEIERRDLFLHALDDERRWFRYHNLFAEFLRRRLEREAPERIGRLHRIAAKWLAEHGFLSEAVDHTLATDNLERAAELIEAHGMDLIEDSKMSTVLGLVAKLPEQESEARPRLQLIVAWANAILHRPVATRTALRLVDTALNKGVVSDSVAHDLRVEASVISDVDAVHADSIDEPNSLTVEATQRSDSIRPLAVVGAANVASYVEICRFKFSEARDWQQWAAPHHRRTHGPFGEIIGHCIAGIAANEQLDVVSAEYSFRTALHLAHASTGVHSYPARLAGALLGDLLYERGELDLAEQLLDESHQLGAECGLVDLLLASYGTGSRIKAIRGKVSEAKERLAEGVRTGVRLSLPRLIARLNNEGIRMGAGRISELLPAPTRMTAGCRQARNIIAVTAELDEDSEIRMLLAETNQTHLDEACNRAAGLVQTVSSADRSRAALEATLLHAQCLARGGRTNEAIEVLAPAAEACAQHNLVRPLIDSGPDTLAILTAARSERGMTTASFANIPEDFLTQVLADPTHTSGITQVQRAAAPPPDDSTAHR